MKKSLQNITLVDHLFSTNFFCIVISIVFTQYENQCLHFLGLAKVLLFLMKLTYSSLLDPQISRITIYPSPQDLIDLFCIHPGQLFIGATLFPGIP